MLVFSGRVGGGNAAGTWAKFAGGLQSEEGIRFETPKRMQGTRVSFEIRYPEPKPESDDEEDR